MNSIIDGPFLRWYEPGVHSWSFGFDPVNRSAFYRKTTDEADEKLAANHWKSMGLTPMQTKILMSEAHLLAKFADKDWGCMGRHLDGEKRP